MRDLAVNVDTLLRRGNIILGDIRVDIDVDEAVAHGRNGYSLLGVDRILQNLDIQVVADRLHTSALLGTEQVPRTAQLQIAHGNFEAAAELGELADSLQAFGRDFAEQPAAPVGKVRIRLAGRPAYTSADLMELRKAPYDRHPR